MEFIVSIVCYEKRLFATSLWPYSFNPKNMRILYLWKSSLLHSPFLLIYDLVMLQISIFSKEIFLIPTIYEKDTNSVMILNTKQYL